MEQYQQYHDNITGIEEISSQNHYNYNKAHGTGRFMTPEDCEAIKTAYLDTISDTMSGAVARMIEDAFKAGLTADEIVMAIEETGFAPRPSPLYLRKILQNWAESGCVMSKLNKNNSHINRDVKPWWR